MNKQTNKIKKCIICNKKTLYNTKCRCNKTVCLTHLKSDAHNCTFNYKELKKQQIKHDNPIIKPSKVIEIK